MTVEPGIKKTTLPSCKFDRVLQSSIQLPKVASGETGGNRWLLFLARSLFGGHGGVFFLIGAGGFGLFLARLLLGGFRGFIAHNFYLVLQVDSPAA